MLTPVASTSKAKAPETSPATLKDVHLLIQYTMRFFYDSRQVTLMDQIIRGEPAVKDEALAAKIGVQMKDVAKIAQPLIDARILAIYRRNEVKEGSQKATSRAWYWLDLKTLIDVIKWRMYKVRKTIDDKLRDETRSQGYDCPLCKQKYTTLDVLHLRSDPVTYEFHCETCDSILIDNESTKEAELGKTKIRRLLEQCKPVMDGLKRTESFVVPAFNVSKWLEINYPVADSVSVTKVGADGIKIAAGGGQAAKVKIEMADEADLLALKQAKEKETEAIRAQNALPAWIERSTISGALTAAGAKQQSASEVLHQQAAPASPGKEAKADVSSADDQALIDYYAKMQAQAPTSTVPSLSPAPASTKALSPRPTAAHNSASEDEDDLFEPVLAGDPFTPPTSYEEDVKPINKPRNANGKRSRDASEESVAFEEDFGGFEVDSKRVKLEEDVEAPGALAASLNADGSPAPAPVTSKLEGSAEPARTITPVGVGREDEGDSDDEEFEEVEAGEASASTTTPADAIRDDKKPETWLVLKYQGASNKLELDSSGSEESPLAQIKERLNADEVAYAYARIKYSNDKESFREKFIFVTWLGESVKVMRKARVSTHKADVQQVLRQFSIEVPVSHTEELDEDTIVTRLRKAGGANYGAGI